MVQAARDLGVHENLLRQRVGETAVDPPDAFLSRSVMKPEQAELGRLKEENAKFRMDATC